MDISDRAAGFTRKWFQQLGRRSDRHILELCFNRLIQKRFVQPLHIGRNRLAGVAHLSQKPRQARLQPIPFTFVQIKNLPVQLFDFLR